MTTNTEENKEPKPIAQARKWAKDNPRGNPPEYILMDLYNYWKRNKGKRGYGAGSLRMQIGISKSRIGHWLKVAKKIEKGERHKSKNLSVKSKPVDMEEIDKRIAARRVAVKRLAEEYDMSYFEAALETMSWR